MDQDKQDFVLVNMKESFAEVAVFSGGQPVFSRSFLPKTSISKEIHSLLQQHSLACPNKIYLTTKLTKTIIERRLGTPPALLVTGGFENWLDMTIPPKETFFTVELTKADSPLSKDFIFGIKERTSSSGEILESVDTEELEFLAAKLRLNKIDQVSICFLHSDKNPDNERIASDYFRAQGFKVYSSHNQDFDRQQTSGPKTERQLWWNAVLNAYCAPTFFESLQEIESQLVETFGEQVQLFLGQANGDFVAKDQALPLSTLFADEYFLKEHLRSDIMKSNGKQRKTLGCFFGLERFLLFPIDGQQSDIWQSEFGPIAAHLPSHSNFSLQPTSRVEKGFWSCPTFSKQQQGWEPGPMCLGRSTRPTLIDTMYLSNLLPETEGLSSLLKEKSKSRIQETLFAFSKSERSPQSISSPEIVEGLNEILITALSGQINALDYNYVVCCGPLASGLFEPLKTRLSGKQVKLMDDDFLSVRSIVPGGNR